MTNAISICNKREKKYIMLNFSPSGSKTFDDAFTKSYNLIMNKYPMFMMNINNTYYYDKFIQKMITFSHENNSIFTLDEIGELLNAMLDGYNVNNQIENVICEFICIIAKGDESLYFGNCLYQYKTYTYKFTHSLIDDICKLLSHGITWPFHTDFYIDNEHRSDIGLEPVAFYYLLQMHPALDDWWLNYTANGDSLYVVNDMSRKYYCYYGKTSVSHIKTILTSILDNDFLIPINVIKYILSHYSDAVYVETTMNMIERLQSIKSTDDVSLADLSTLDSTYIIHSVCNAIMLICKELTSIEIHDKEPKSMLANIDYHKNIDFNQKKLSSIYLLIDLLFDIINNDNYDAVTIAVLCNFIIIISEINNEVNDEYHINIYNSHCLHEIMSSYPAIIYDSIYYPSEFIKEKVKTIIINGQ